MSNRSSKKDSKNYFTYGDIPLRLYYQILESKDFSLLCRKGKPSRLEERWEEIVKAVEKFNNSLWYFNHLDDLRDLRYIMSKYLIIKASLNLLLYKPNKTVVKELAEEHDVKIDMTNSATYALSLFNALQNVENFITKLNMKKNEMNLGEEDGEKKSKVTFDSVMANLSMNLGFVIPEDITLARFNEYNKSLQEKNRPKMKEDNG